MYEYTVRPDAAGLHRGMYAWTFERSGVERLFAATHSPCSVLAYHQIPDHHATRYVFNLSGSDRTTNSSPNLRTVVGLCYWLFLLGYSNQPASGLDPSYPVPNNEVPCSDKFIAIAPASNPAAALLTANLNAKCIGQRTAC